MPLQKLSNTAAFIVRDIPDVPAAGVVRTGRKILQSSAKDMARSISYTFGLFGLPLSGASAGLNYEGDALAEEIGTFSTEIAPQFDAGTLDLGAGKGIDPALVAELSAHSEEAKAAATAQTIVATAAHLRGGDLTGTRIAIEGRPPAVIGEQLMAAGAELVTVEGADKKPWLVWGAEADIILAGSKIGALTHEGVPSITAPIIIGWGPAAITTKAFAMLSVKGVNVIPAFLAASGGYLLGHAPASDLPAAIATALDAAKAADDTVFIGACKVAEDFIATWSDARLFGRPFG